MWPRFGLKMGNSTLCIALIKADGAIEVIANKQGDRVSHACLLWNGGEDIECGLTAKQKLATKPKQGISNSFQLLMPNAELSEARLESAIKDLTCDYDATKNAFTLKCGGGGDDEAIETKSLSPLDVHIQLFKAELELARQYYSGDATRDKPLVVLSIPTYYPETAWPILCEAAETAGFHVAQLINESTAAVLAYGIGEQQQSKSGGGGGGATASSSTTHVLTIKSGGLWSHFVLYRVRDGLYTKLESYGPFAIGGKRYDDALVQFICDEFQRKYKLDPHESRRSMAKIRVAAANCKHILTQLPSTQVYIDSLMDGVDFNMQMSRARFESLIQPVIADFMATLSQSVEDALTKHAEIKKIDSIVLLGATTEIPKLQAAIEARFPEAKLHASLSSNEVVAIGCARQANFLLDVNLDNGVEGGRTKLNAAELCACNEGDLRIWHGEDEQNAKVIIEKGTLLPRTVRLDVAPCTTTGRDTTIFRLRMGEDGEVIEANLAEATTNEDGYFHIEARVEDAGLPSEGKDKSIAATSAVAPAPVIRLRCL